jgi:hypothetical protein
MKSIQVAFVIAIAFAGVACTTGDATPDQPSRADVTVRVDGVEPKSNCSSHGDCTLCSWSRDLCEGCAYVGWFEQCGSDMPALTSTGLDEAQGCCLANAH